MPSPPSPKRVTATPVWPRGRWGSGDGVVTCATGVPEDMGVLHTDEGIRPRSRGEPACDVSACWCRSSAPVVLSRTCNGRPRTTDNQTLLWRRGHLQEQWLRDAFASRKSDSVSGAVG